MAPSRGLAAVQSHIVVVPHFAARSKVLPNGFAKRLCRKDPLAGKSSSQNLGAMGKSSVGLIPTGAFIASPWHLPGRNIKSIVAILDQQNYQLLAIVILINHHAWITIHYLWSKRMYFTHDSPLWAINHHTNHHEITRKSHAITMKSHELTRSASLFPARGLVLWLRVPSHHGGHLTGAEETGDSLESLADIRSL